MIETLSFLQNSSATMFATIIGGAMAATALALAVRNHITKPVSVSTIVKDLENTVGDLKLHAENKFSEIVHHNAVIDELNALKNVALEEHAKANEVAAKIGSLIGLHA